MDATNSPAQKSVTAGPAPPAPPGLDDYVRTVIACTIVFGGLITIIAVWAYRPVTDAQAFSTVITGLIGGVLGYYFGASGKQKSDSTAQAATTKVETMQTAVRKAHARVAEAKGRLKAERALSVSILGFPRALDLDPNWVRRFLSPGLAGATASFTYHSASSLRMYTESVLLQGSRPQDVAVLKVNSRLTKVQLDPRSGS